MNPITTGHSAVPLSAAEARIRELKETLSKLFNISDELLLEEFSARFIWRELTGGQCIFRQGEAGESLYILISGRLKAVIHLGTANEKVVGEISKGQSVGEMALMVGEPRSASVVAIRDSVLVELSRAHFEELVAQHPGIAMGISRIIVNRLNNTMHHTKPPTRNYTIALVPATPDIPIRELSSALLEALSSNREVLHLNYDRLPGRLKPEGGEEEDSFRLGQWLTEQEMQHDYILYETDLTHTDWTRKCLRQADKIILIANPHNGTALSDVELELLTDKSQHYAQTKELVLLYPEETEFPTLSHGILANRPVNRHYNIRMGDRNHMARLARMMTDSGIGLVLSGGGARGFAHIGIFKAMKEMGLPVDMVCGTSIGSIIAAGIAIDYDLAHLMSQYRKAFVDEKPLSDYTLPILSLIKGHKLQRVNRKYFKDYHIEDLWLNFFCVSSNYTTSELVIHDRGPLWKAVTASASIPGVLPPIVEGNHLLVDGGVVNNFPVDIMKSRYGGKLIGIDLKIEKEYKLNYDRLPGGWHLFFSRFLPFLRKYRTPGIATIMMKSTLLASAGHQRKMVEDLHLYLRPPVGNFGLLRLDEFDKIVQAGYTYARETLTPADLKALVESPK